MSFGFAIDDFIAVSRLANEVRKRLVDSPDRFTALAQETKCSSNLVQDLDGLAPHRILNPSKKQQPEDLSRGCQAVLQSINRAPDRYHVLGIALHDAGNAAKRFWKRLVAINLESGHFDNSRLIAQIMEQRGADVNHRNARGVTPLHHPGTKCSAELLLDGGAQIDAENDKGESPLFNAIRAERWYLAELYLERGATANISNGEGKNPLHLAVLNFYPGTPDPGAILLYGTGTDVAAREGKLYLFCPNWKS